MIKLTATARIHSISPVIQVTDKFSKRELVLNDSWEKNGEVHPNFVIIEFSNNSMNLLNNLIPGQTVTVEATVTGRDYKGRVFNTIRGTNVTLAQGQQQNYAQAAPMPGAYPQQPSYPNAPGF